MSAFDDALREAREAHVRDVGDLLRAVSVLAIVPDYSAHEDEDVMLARREMVRLAKLYARRGRIEGVPIQYILQRLSEGLR